MRRWLHNFVNTLKTSELFPVLKKVNFMVCDLYPVKKKKIEKSE